MDHMHMHQQLADNHSGSCLTLVPLFTWCWDMARLQFMGDREGLIREKGRRARGSVGE